MWIAVSICSSSKYTLPVIIFEHQNVLQHISFNVQLRRLTVYIIFHLIYSKYMFGTCATNINNPNLLIFFSLEDYAGYDIKLRVPYPLVVEYRILRAFDAHPI